MTAPRKLYSFLLLAASLRCIEVSERSVFTRGFERVSAAALKAWLPRQAQVHIFGTSAERSARYRGTLQRKLQRLADDLSERLLLTDDQFRRGDAGDAGGDVVAWLPLGDENNSRLVLIAQATCEVNWEHKQHEAGHAVWRGIMTFAAPHANVMFVPFCFRNPDGEWFWSRWIHESILIDRVRLLWLLKGQAASLTAAPYDLVDRALAYREEII